jgi:microcystin-dependent protein
MEPFLGQISTFGFNFAPRGWASCDGQLLAIAQNQSLYSLLGTIYGGDGRTSFALPELRGRTPLHQGDGAGLSNRPIGQKAGAENNRLTANQLPAHGHGVSTPVSDDDATTEEANGNVLATAAVNIYSTGASAGKSYQGFNTGNAGASSDLNNMQPFLVINFCIAIQGLFPSRN